MTDRTPGPWYYGIAYQQTPIPFDYNSPGYYDNAGIIGANGTTVVGCDEYHIFHSEADAAFIVRACNSHDELVGALNFILKFYEPGNKHLDTEAWKVAEASARAVMAKVQP